MNHSVDPPLSQTNPRPDSLEEEAARLLSEADSFLRLALVDKATAHLAQALKTNPALRVLREPLVKLFVIQHQYQQAIIELWQLVSLCQSPHEEVRFLRYILRLGETEPAARERLNEISGQLHGQLPSTGGIGVGPQLSLTTVDQELRRYLGSHRPSTDLAQTQVITYEPLPRHQIEEQPAPSAVTLPDTTPVAALAKEVTDSCALPPVPRVRTTIELDVNDIQEERAVLRAAPSVHHPAPPSADTVPQPDCVNEAARAFRTGVKMRRAGLHERAAAMFEKARGDTRLSTRAALLAGLCYRDLNRIPEAISQLMHGVNLPQASEQELIELFYELGYAYELIDNAGEAILFYQLTLGASGEFRDAAERVARLQKSYFTT